MLLLRRGSTIPKLTKVPALMSVLLALSIATGCSIAATEGGGPAAPAAPVITLNPPTSSTSSTISLSSTPGAAIYYTLDGSAPTTSSTAYSSDSPINAYGNVTEAIKAFAVMNNLSSAVAARTFAAASITPFSIAATSSGVTFTLNGNTFVVDLTVNGQITFQPDSGWFCAINGDIISETSSHFQTLDKDWGIPYTVIFMNAAAPSSATIYFQVTNVIVTSSS